MKLLKVTSPPARRCFAGAGGTIPAFAAARTSLGARPNSRRKARLNPQRAEAELLGNRRDRLAAARIAQTARLSRSRRRRMYPVTPP